jgi:hypothetical protein
MLDEITDWFYVLQEISNVLMEKCDHYNKPRLGNTVESHIRSLRVVSIDPKLWKKIVLQDVKSHNT